MAVDRTPAARPRSPLIVRTRLLDRLARRFEVRVMTVTGGAGSGKTTALAQALDAPGNGSDRSDGIDVWYPCTAADFDPGALVERLSRAVELTLDLAPATTAASALDTLVEHVLGASPHQVCLVLDDVHVLPSGAALDEVIEALPTNGHVVLAGRRMPPLQTARIDAARQLVEISQDELLMTQAEQIEFANRRGIDVGRLAGAEGWPAFIELASEGGEARSRRYLQQEAIAALEPERRQRLARFAFVGGGDDAVARAVTGAPLDELVAGVPLVRWSGSMAHLHDLWSEMLGTELSSGERVATARAATAVHRDRLRIDEAVELATSVGDGEDLEKSVALAIEHGIDGGLHRDRLDRWLSLLETLSPESPLRVLIGGLIEVENDSTSAAAWEQLDRAACLFADRGDDEMELVALAQLGYVARCLQQPEAIAEVMGRIAILSERHRPAAPFLAFGEAWTALTAARADLQLAAMERIADESLPRTWSLTRDHLRAHALFSLGRADEAIEWVPRGMTELPVPIPGALTTESQAHWQAGRPEVARSLAPTADIDRYSLRDRYLLDAWTTMMDAYAGDLDSARRRLALLADLEGERLGGVDKIFGPALGALLAASDGDEATAASALQAILQYVPLGGGVSEQAFRGHAPLLYVLLPETRTFWDGFITGPTATAGLSAARLLVDGRREPAVLADRRWPEPGHSAAALPVGIAVELALLGVRAGCHEGRVLAAWLTEHWGAPARGWIRRFFDDERLGEAAATVMATTPTPPLNRAAVEVLGPTTLRIDGHASSDPNWRRERVRALLGWLVLHPRTTRDQAAGALWPDLPAEKAAKNLRTTLNYLHDVLEPRRSSGEATWYVRVAAQHIELHDDLDVDLWTYRRLLERADAAEAEGRVRDALLALRDAARLWHGDLAVDLDYEWLELDRIHVRSRFVRASCRAAELLTATDRPNDAIELLRPALAADPWHARSYDALAAAYEAVGDLTSAQAIVRRAEAAGVGN